MKFRKESKPKGQMSIVYIPVPDTKKEMFSQ